jgi:predicted MPP superfamily phosphohydrolase
MTMLPAVISALLFAGACLGHLGLMIMSHNWFYGLSLSKRVGDFFHLLHGLLVGFFPVLLWWLTRGSFPELWTFRESDSALALVGRWVLLLYIVLCLTNGFVILPLITVKRYLRRPPAAVQQTRSRVFDIAEELGYRPTGEGRQRSLTRLPANEVFQVELAERTLFLPRLPGAWEGLTILHLSDIHLNGTPDRSYYHFLLERCNEWRPDLVALTGDVADSIHHQRWIVPVLGRLRWNLAAFAILGNHDYWYDPPFIRRRLRRLGMHVLSNLWQQFEVRGEPLVVIGHEGPWLKPAPDLSKCPTGPFRLCLSHTPDNIRWAQRAQVDLMLSGHVHGGQIRFPVIGSVLVPSLYGRRYDCGTFDEPPTLLHVTRGVSGEHPLRYGCKPEVTLLTLRCAKASSAR